jgi:hypothetical protein
MADLTKIAEQLSELSVLEAAELVKMLEEKWGVSAAAPVAVAAAAGPAAAAEPVEEKTEFDVVLKTLAPRRSMSSKSSAPSLISALSKPKPCPRPLAPKFSPLLVKRLPPMPNPNSKLPVQSSSLPSFWHLYRQRKTPLNREVFYLF